MIQQLELIRKGPDGVAEFLNCNVDWPKKLKRGQEITLKERGPDECWIIRNVYSVPVDHTIQKFWTGSNHKK